jgi:hypothetical protein
LKTAKANSQIAGVLHFFGPHQERIPKEKAKPTPNRDFGAILKPITVPTNPAIAAGNKGRRIGQLVFIQTKANPSYTALKRNLSPNLHHPSAALSLALSNSHACK